MKNRDIKHSDNWATPTALYDALDKNLALILTLAHLTKKKYCLNTMG